MNRRMFLSRLGAGLAAAALAPGLARAEAPVDAVVRQLESFGYRDVSVRRTLLGRMRITARRGDTEREIVLDPRTGEILRDLLRDRRGRHIPELSDGSSAGRSYDKDSGSYDDDRDDRDDDDDHSGSDSDDDDSDDSSGSGSGSDDDD
ncbi:hypothetical protein [Pseudothioclava arenosa]|nr:hypothetical protein [Pseudothioclava arenosa]